MVVVHVMSILIVVLRCVSIDVSIMLGMALIVLSIQAVIVLILY